MDIIEISRLETIIYKLIKKIKLNDYEKEIVRKIINEKIEFDEF